jgi:SAM-dependent MidA family methyltransferase
MSEEVASRIRAAIADHGPITFAEFMEHALYGPGGFYERPPVGVEGHFVTSPHVHAVFADLLRFALDEMRESLGDPEPFQIVEVGAGDGTLARQLLFGFAEADHVAVDYTAIEISTGAREALSGLPVRVATAIEEVAQIGRACVFANELLDNLPFRRVRRHADRLSEVRVEVDGERLVDVESACDAELVALAPAIGDGEEATVPTGALEFVDRLARVLVHGYALLIDYGSGTTGSGATGSAGEVHGYRDQRVLEDVFDDPGSADVTAGVNFPLVTAIAERCGLRTLGTVTQRDALLALGFDRWSERARAAQTRLLAERGANAARVWESRSRASLLVDPAGLGRLKWLLLATVGLPTPAWMDRAAATKRLSPD